MSTLIQCPACSQKFNMQGRLPALFTCTKCKQAMDLTSFPGYVPEPAAAPSRAGPARAAAPERGGGRSASRRRAREEDEDGGGRRHAVPAKKSNQGLLIAGIVGVLAVVVVVVVVMSKKGDAPAPAPAGPEVAKPGTEPGTSGAATPAAGTPAAGTPAAGTPGAGTPAAGTPAAGTPAGGTPAAGTPTGGDPKAAGGSGQIKVWTYPEDVTPEEKQKIDKALDTAINDTGASQREAEALLVSMGRKAVWRLVSEFRHIQDTHTYESRRGKISAMIVDRTLRKIDGFMERMTGYKEHVNPESTLEYMNGVAKRWNGWLETGMWKTERKPWDPKVDGSDEPKEKPAPSGR